MRRPLVIEKTEKSQARGRNGWYVPRSYFIEKSGEILSIGVMSMRRVFPSPIYMSLSTDDAKQLAEDIIRVVNAREARIKIGNHP